MDTSHRLLVCIVAHFLLGLIPGTDSAITVGPTNFLAINGASHTFTCTTTCPTNEWFFTPPGGPTLVFFLFGVPQNNPPRFTEVGGNLVLTNSRFSEDAGTYTCRDSCGATFSADLETYNDTPFCKSTQTPFGYEIEFGTITENCGIDYHGGIVPTATWTHQSGAAITGTDTLTNLNRANHVEERLGVIATQQNHNNGDGTGLYQCTVRLQGSPNVAGAFPHAGNALNLVQTCTVPMISTRWCPRNIVISPIPYKLLPPQTLTCTANCNPPCSYSFTNRLNGTVTGGNTMVVDMSMTSKSYEYYCTACTTIKGYQCCDNEDLQFQVLPGGTPPNHTWLELYIGAGLGIAGLIGALIGAVACYQYGGCHIPGKLTPPPMPAAPAPAAPAPQMFQQVMQAPPQPPPQVSYAPPPQQSFQSITNPVQSAASGQPKVLGKIYM